MGRVPCEIELTSDSNRHGRATPSAQPVVCGAHLRHGEHAGFDFGLDPGGCEVVDCAEPTACACGTRLTLLELVWWVRVAHCAWLLFVSFAYFTETPGCEVSGPQPAILLAYAFHAWRIVMKL